MALVWDALAMTCDMNDEERKITSQIQKNWNDEEAWTVYRDLLLESPDPIDQEKVVLMDLGQEASNINSRATDKLSMYRRKIERQEDKLRDLIEHRYNLPRIISIHFYRGNPRSLCVKATGDRVKKYGNVPSFLRSRHGRFTDGLYFLNCHFNDEDIEGICGLDNPVHHFTMQAPMYTYKRTFSNDVLIDSLTRSNFTLQSLVLHNIKITEHILKKILHANWPLQWLNIDPRYQYPYRKRKWRLNAEGYHLIHQLNDKGIETNIDELIGKRQ